MAFVVIALPLLGGCFDVIGLRPELRAPASRRDAVGLADALERLIDEGRASNEDREAAYRTIKQWRAEAADYAYARASIAGRLAQARGVTAVHLIHEMESWGTQSMKLDPRWRDGAARRLLGTLYVLLPGNLVRHGNSEEGLELLEKQTEEYPRDPANHLRLAEAYISLNDPEPAFEHLCFASAHELRTSEEQLLRSLLEQIGGKSKLRCDE